MGSLLYGVLGLPDSRKPPHVPSKVRLLIDRAGASHKPPHTKNMLIDAPHSFAVKLVLADIDAYHVCPKQMRQTAAGGRGRSYYALERVGDHATQQQSDGISTYAYCPDKFDWSHMYPEFQRCVNEVSEEALSVARVSVLFGQLFFWGPKLDKEASQRPGALEKLNFQDCRRQWAARLKSSVKKKMSQVLGRSSFTLSQRVTNITYYVKTEEDGAKLEVTFFDPQCSHAKAAEMKRIWECTSHLEVLKVPEGQEHSRSRVETARRMLELYLRPAHNEFEGCWCARDIIARSAEGLLSDSEFRTRDAAELLV